MTDEYGMKREPRPCMRPPPKPERTGVRPKDVIHAAEWLWALGFVAYLLWSLGLVVGGAAIVAMALCALLFIVAERWASGDRWPWERKQ